MATGRELAAACDLSNANLVESSLATCYHAVAVVTERIGKEQRFRQEMEDRCATALQLLHNA